MRITGKRGTAPLRGRPHLVGVYTGNVGEGPPRREGDPKSSIECPFCHNHLAIRQNATHRVIWQGKKLPGDRVDVIVDPVPSTHVVLGCLPCKVSFTTERGNL